MIKLNLGCGQNKKAGYTNVDKYDSFVPDVVWDLEKFPWPFETHSIDEIILNHVLEHLGKDTDVFLSIMSELYRICCADAKIYLAVPHPRSDDFINDPSHVRIVTEGVMELFSKKNNDHWRTTGAANTPFAHYINVDFEIEKVEYILTPQWIKKMQDGSLTPDALAFAFKSHNNVISETKIVLVVKK